MWEHIFVPDFLYVTVTYNHVSSTYWLFAKSKYSVLACIWQYNIGNQLYAYTMVVVQYCYKIQYSPSAAASVS